MLTMTPEPRTDINYVAQKMLELATQTGEVVVVEDFNNGISLSTAGAEKSEDIIAQYNKVFDTRKSH